MGKSSVLGPVDGVWTGGAFWDGRASGWTDGTPLIEQAKGPRSPNSLTLTVCGIEIRPFCSQ